MQASNRSAANEARCEGNHSGSKTGVVVTRTGKRGVRIVPQNHLCPSKSFKI